MTNAIESMAMVAGRRLLAVRSNVRDDGGVMVSVADTGTGIDPQDVQRLFSPLFTTKASGMGMGLFDLPFDHRTARPHAVGRAQRTAGRDLSIRSGRRYRIIRWYPVSPGKVQSRYRCQLPEAA
jgi:hypothetical protein